MIELSRDITFGQYINNGSVLTRMDPRAKLLCAIVLIALVSSIGSFIAFGICLLVCIILHWMSRIPVAYVLRGFRAIAIFLLFIYIIEVLFYYSPTQHTTLIWQWGIFTVSWEGIVRNLLIMVRVIFLYYLSSMLMFATSLVDLTDGSEALLSPLQKLGIPVNAFIMVLVIAFKFVPIFVAEIERLIKAQSARGVRFDKGNFLQRATKLGPLLIPLFLSGFRRAEALSIAMEARGYAGAVGGASGWRRSKRRAMHLQRFDTVALVFIITFCVVTIIVSLVAPY